MPKLARVVTMGVLILAFVAITVVAAFGGAPKKCAPGQHANPHPGFKPGVCHVHR